MRLRELLTTAALAVGVLTMAGCNQSSPGGHPENKSDTFKISGPSMTTTIKQGDKQTVKLSISRGKDFKQDVTLTAADVKGLTVMLEPKVFKGSEQVDVSMTIDVAKDAAVGEHTIKVTGKPESGVEAPVDVKVKVEPK